jgi:Domain of unknown function (DUF6362)
MSYSARATVARPFDARMVAERFSVSPQELQSWLEWAGGVLLSAPSPPVRPRGHKTNWPDFPQDPWEITTFRLDAPRPIVPSPDEIEMMEHVLLLPNILDDIWKRRIVHARSLVFPITRHHRYRWSQIAKLLHTSPYHVKRLHAKGIAEICERSDREKLQRISAFLSHRSLSI